MLIGFIVGAVWLAVLVLVVALCWAADAGDRAMETAQAGIDRHGQSVPGRGRAHGSSRGARRQTGPQPLRG